MRERERKRVIEGVVKIGMRKIYFEIIVVSLRVAKKKKKKFVHIARFCLFSYNNKNCIANVYHIFQPDVYYAQQYNNMKII